MSHEAFDRSACPMTVTEGAIMLAAAATGKVVWCEQLVPEDVTVAMLAALGTEAPVLEAEVATV